MLKHKFGIILEICGGIQIILNFLRKGEVYIDYVENISYYFAAIWRKI